MNIRAKHFAKHYVLDPETKGNAEQSAIKAGYAVRYANGNAYKLVTRSGIAELISKHEQELQERLTVNLEEKIKIAWENYLSAIEKSLPQQAEKWFDQHGRLAGDYIQKVESKDTTDYTKDEDKEITALRNRIASSN